MTSDHDPRELRAIALKYAQEIRERRREIHRILLPHANEVEQWEEAADRTTIMAKYILATVQEDDGEEQENVTVDVYPIHQIRLTVDRYGVWLGSGCAETVVIPTRPTRPTRGQFRDLCRGLGITLAAATPETPG